MDDFPVDDVVPAPVNEYCTNLVSRLPDVLGSQLVAVYLYGSATIGDFDPASSDLDLVLVVEGNLGVTAKSALIRMLWATAPDVPARGMECWVISTETARAGGTMRDFELKVNTHPVEPVTRDGTSGAPGIPVVELDLIVETGRGFFGPPIRDLVAAIPRSLVVQSMVENLRVESPDSSEYYSVLNASRSLAYLVTGEHMSKLQGGHWVLEQGSASKVVEESVRTQMGLAPERGLTSSGRRYVKDAIRRLESDI